MLDTLRPFSYGNRTATLHSLVRLEELGFGDVSRLPVCLRVILESLLRNLDGKRVTEADVRALASWQPKAEREAEIPFVVARVLLQDFTGVPLVVDLAAMRSAIARLGKNPTLAEPQVPVDLVIDHSVQVDYTRSSEALSLNMQIEFQRNQERYRFLKWGMQAFDGLKIVPPGIGIVHQVNLEHLAQCVIEKDGVAYPDTCVGTDSHTPMVNGLGIVAWGVGGIEAEAAMLGQPVYFLTPDVVGVNLTGKLAEGVTATDLVLTVTELLRKAKVVGKLVEFHGEGAASLPVAERATISNMAPEYGATIGYFPVDEESCRYLAQTGRAVEADRARAYYQAQKMFGIPQAGQCDYSSLLELDLSTVRPCVSGPKRPQDRIDLPSLKEKFLDLLTRTDATGFARPASEVGQTFRGKHGAASGPVSGGGEQDPSTAPDARRKNTSSRTEAEMMNNRPTPDVVDASATQLPNGSGDIALRHGQVLIAAITSCTNTSNPSVMLAAGLVAKKAVERGLTTRTTVKTSLAPGSRVVTHYLEKTGLAQYLDAVGFNTVGYGCTTCIGNSGPLDPRIEEVITDHEVVGASVLSGNRNFEARVHQSIKANFLMSPPLVVAFALAGRVDIDLTKEPLGTGKDGRDVFLKDIWPTMAEVAALRAMADDPEGYRQNYGDFSTQNQWWNSVATGSGKIYPWDPDSEYIQEPPYFTGFEHQPKPVAEITGARPLAIFGDSITTDHISPAGSIKASSPAGKYLLEKKIGKDDFNSYGARRGNHHVMVRGTFANVRVKNLMLPGVEGGVTKHMPDGAQMSIHEASLLYAKERVPLIVIAGQEYGSGSSRDWAAKGPALLGVRAVVAKSYERIHRSNLIMMGVLPCQFPDGTDAATLKLDGSERFDLVGITQPKPRLPVTLRILREGGRVDEVTVIVRIDTPIEVEYYKHGGILPYVLRQIVARG